MRAWLTILVTLSFISLLVALALSRPVLAADAPKCSYVYDQVIASFADGTKFHEIAAEDIPKVMDDLKAITGETYGPVTRAFIASDGTTLYLGIEVDGCLLPAIPVGPVPAPARSVESGKTALGIGA